MSVLERYRPYLTALTRALAARFGSDLVAVVVYGSAARGTATETSDIDVLIILRKASESYYERLKPVLEEARRLRRSSDLRPLFREGEPLPVSFLILSEAEARENRYIFLDMVEEAVPLYDPRGFFAQRMAALRKRLQELGSQRVRLPDGTWYWDLKPNLRIGEVFEL